MGRVSALPRAVALPWLRPTAAGLLALTDDPPDRPAARDCPGTVAHVLRYARPTPDADSFRWDDALGLPGVCLAAAEFVAGPHGWPADWTTAPWVGPHLAAGRRAARAASAIAVETGLCSPDAAWASALLAPLGWYAVAAAGDADPGPGFDAAAVARRLAFRWRLPTAFAVTIGCPALAPDDAERLGGHAGLHRVVQTAVETVEKEPPAVPPVLNVPDPDPKLLAKLLRSAAVARQRGGAAVVADLEAQIDGLAGLLADARAGFDVAVRDAKLAALAEFAAGASHEINNPLAVISGNAQLLLAGEADPDRRRRLGGVVRAVARVHDILVGTRQFARPPAPSPGILDVRAAVEAALDAHRPAPAESGVRFDFAPAAGDRTAVQADPGQVRLALGNLVRNAVEAAGAGGWVRVTVAAAGRHTEIAVEDGGPGPAADAVPHLFDPFYSGREAGRGRGLGLSVAWQLARQNGGSVRFDSVSGGPTRFVLTLPTADPAAVPADGPGKRRTA